MAKPWRPAREVEGFIKAFVDDIADGAAAIFAGAGLSVASGHVNWAELLRNIASELGLDVDREHNLVAVAQYHLNERGSRSRLNQTLINEFSAGHRINANHEILARLPIATYWTTNYDRLIETALEAEHKVVDVKFMVDQLKTTRRYRDATVFKMHGDVSDAEHAVLTKDDYEGYFRDREPFVTALAGDLVSRTLLFIGFSFTDPNIDYIMSRVRVVLRHSPKQHYCILRRESKRPREKKSDYEYRQRQQQYFTRDLNRIGIQALLIDEYGELTEILRLIEARYRQRKVFISGSAYSFEPFKADDAARLIEGLGSELVMRGFGVVTGFGLGVGPSVIAGAMQTIQRDPTRYRPGQLEAMPFPVADPASSATKGLYEGHRRSMLSRCGVAVFLFGNKRNDKDATVEADGVREEYALAKSLGLKVVAIGCTGWVARDIWALERPAVAGLPPAVRKAYERLGDAAATPAQLIAAAMTVVEALRD